MAMSETATNDTRYALPRMTPRQQRLLRRIHEATTPGYPGGPLSVDLARGEVASATGLEHRDVPLVRTDRPRRKHAFSGPKPGTARRAWLTVQGRAVAKRLPPLAPEQAEPLSFEECAELLRVLADAVLRDGDTVRTHNVARRAREALLRKGVGP